MPEALHRVLVRVAFGVLAVVVALGLWLVLAPSAPRTPVAPTEPSVERQAAADRAGRPRLVPAPQSPPTGQGGCGPSPGFGAAAAGNAATLDTLAWSPFRRVEVGWATYAPLIAHEAGTACPPQSQTFAARLAAWQRGQRLAPSGLMGAETFSAMLRVWHGRRPFVLASHQACPDPPPPEALAAARPEEGYLGKSIQLRADALDAYRRLVGAFRAAEPSADGALLSVFSGYRGPEEEAARCVDGSCGGPEKARCSAHRTGRAIDLYLGAAPGSRPESSDDINRLFQSRAPAYRWLVVHAGDYGFQPYPFEPWHWEYVAAP